MAVKSMRARAKGRNVMPHGTAREERSNEQRARNGIWLGFR